VYGGRVGCFDGGGGPVLSLRSMVGRGWRISLSVWKRRSCSKEEEKGQSQGKERNDRAID